VPGPTFTEETRYKLITKRWLVCADCGRNLKLVDVESRDKPRSAIQICLDVIAEIRESCSLCCSVLCAGIVLIVAIAGLAIAAVLH